MAYFRELIGAKPRPKFWVKTFLHLVTPGGFGYIRKLRTGRDSSYVHERDKHEVRYKHHGGGGWTGSKIEGGLHGARAGTLPRGTPETLLPTDRR
jgi:hypothetical protein